MPATPDAAVIGDAADRGVDDADGIVGGDRIHRNPRTRALGAAWRVGAREAAIQGAGEVVLCRRPVHVRVPVRVRAVAGGLNKGQGGAKLLSQTSISMRYTIL